MHCHRRESFRVSLNRAQLVQETGKGLDALSQERKLQGISEYSTASAGDREGTRCTVTGEKAPGYL
ncbi:UNVERIFIED_CONTAM: hypothetical protein FKN15_060122 [Acipenser sinensis]